MGVPMDPALFGLIFGVGLVIATTFFGWANKKKLDRDAASASTAPVGVAAPSASAAQQAGPSSPMPTSQEPSPGELLFWQSIKDSTVAAEFVAYLIRFPEGYFRELAEGRVVALGGSLPQGRPQIANTRSSVAPHPTATVASALRQTGSSGGGAIVWAALIIAGAIIGAAWFWVSTSSFEACVRDQMAALADNPYISNDREIAEGTCRPK